MHWCIEAVLKVFPAYAANASPVIFSRMNLFGLRRPLDGGKVAWDGKRWLGDGKTVQGILLGPLVGVLFGFLLRGYSTPLAGFLLGFGALFGDLVGSFLKRRFGMPRGANAGLLDRLDFISFALAFSAPVVRWEPKEVVFLLFITPAVHRIANIIGYLMRLKKEPW